jgi:hypothetical protein
MDPVAAETAFRARVAELGGSILGRYINSDIPVSVRCAKGHESSPTPSNVKQGGGICRTCSGKAWDAFYVVRHADEPRVKFGITSGDPRRRLKDHRQAGYTNIMCVATNLPGTVAPATEKAVKAALRDAGEKPVRGTEYFDTSCIGLIMDVAQHWLADIDSTKHDDPLTGWWSQVAGMEGSER